MCAADMRRTFRTLALQVHPDKNPHPDAQLVAAQSS